MKRLLLLLAALVMFTGCEIAVDFGDMNELGLPAPVLTPSREFPTVNLPYQFRQTNWLGRAGQGSCVHATMCSLFRWQGRFEMADWWRTHNGDGEWAEDLATKLDKAGVRYAYTTSGDVKFLEWACSTRRGCGVTVMGGRHMVALVHFDDQWAGILDNNHTDTIYWMPRDKFVAEWKNSNGWAVAVIYAPAPPLP
jgi:hypothetical protein